MAWTNEQEQKLKTMWLAGGTSGDIGKELGYTRNAIMGKVNRLGLIGKKTVATTKTDIPIKRKAIKQKHAAALAGLDTITLDPNTVVLLHEDGQSWTEQEIETLTQMWSWGHDAAEIAAILPPYSKNAITGKVTRLEIGADKGRWLAPLEGEAMPQPTVEEFEAHMNELFNGEYDHHDELQIAIAAMTALIATRRNEERAMELMPDHDEAVRLFDSIHTSRTWQRGTPPPRHWWHPTQGFGAMVLDAAAVIGLMTVHDGKDGRSYGPPDAAEKRKAA